MADRQVGEAPFRGKLQVEAYQAGRAAREAGKSRDELPDYAGSRKSLAASWQAGWDDVGAELAAARRKLDVSKARVVEPAQPPLLHPLAVWPKDKPLPSEYVRPPIPCLECRRLLDDTGGRAVVLRTINSGIAYFRCRCCGHGGPGRAPFKLPVKK